MESDSSSIAEPPDTRLNSESNIRNPKQIHRVNIQKLLINLKKAIGIAPCHSGLAGIFLRVFSAYSCIQKGSRQAGMISEISIRRICLRKEAFSQFKRKLQPFTFEHVA